MVLENLFVRVLEKSWIFLSVKEWEPWAVAAILFVT